MNYSASKIAKALVEIILEKPEEYQKSVKNFLVFCRKMKLNYLLPSILRYLEIEFKRQKEKETLKILSSVKIDEEIINKIKKAVGAQSLEKVEVIEDQSVTAGFIAYYQNKIIDASLENNFRLLKNKIINN
jgi:F0F1-type ATP synthase delta subunit